MTVTPEILAALDDVKTVSAEITAAAGPWSAILPPSVASQIADVQMRLANAVAQLTAALAAL
jgi:hypothetical protein